MKITIGYLLIGVISSAYAGLVPELNTGEVLRHHNNPLEASDEEGIHTITIHEELIDTPESDPVDLVEIQENANSAVKHVQILKPGSGQRTVEALRNHFQVAPTQATSGIKVFSAPPPEVKTIQFIPVTGTSQHQQSQQQPIHFIPVQNPNPFSIPVHFQPVPAPHLLPGSPTIYGATFQYPNQLPIYSPHGPGAIQFIPTPVATIQPSNVDLKTVKVIQSSSSSSSQSFGNNNSPKSELKTYKLVENPQQTVRLEEVKTVEVVPSSAIRTVQLVPVSQQQSQSSAGSEIKTLKIVQNGGSFSSSLNNFKLVEVPASPTAASKTVQYLREVSPSGELKLLNFAKK